MNNQVKLIDADKVFRWAELCVIPVRAEDIRRAYELGLFDPDTPPVPTIKPGDKDAAIANLIADLLFAFINKDENHPHDFEIKAFENALNSLCKHYDQIKYNPRLFEDHLERMREVSGNE